MTAAVARVRAGVVCHGLLATVAFLVAAAAFTAAATGPAHQDRLLLNQVPNTEVSD